MCPQKFLQIYSRAGALDHTMILRVEGQDITLQGRSIASMKGAVLVLYASFAWGFSHMTP